MKSTTQKINSDAAQHRSSSTYINMDMTSDSDDDGDNNN